MSHCVVGSMPTARPGVREKIQTYAHNQKKGDPLGSPLRVRIKTRDLSEKVSQLEAALGQIKRLEGVLPICGCCKKIRDDKEGWHQLEQYISEHSEVLFSYGLCPECLQKEIDKFNSSI